MAKKPKKIIGGNQFTDTLKISGKITTQILLGVLDLGTAYLYQGERNALNRELIKDYWRWREIDRKKFQKSLRDLRQRGFLRSYYEGKDLVLALTDKGKQRAQREVIGEIIMATPEVWDRKWHLVIFDIPEKNRFARTVFRERLQNLGFTKLQKSVFVYPFDATDLVAAIRQNFGLGPEIQYVVADQIEQEQALIEHFLSQGILKKSHLKNG
ncbi:MAG: CRISPR-associated endonuclease Cas2 [Patescibacteria group bacterium]